MFDLISDPYLLRPRRCLSMCVSLLPTPILPHSIPPCLPPSLSASLLLGKCASRRFMHFRRPPSLPASAQSPPLPTSLVQATSPRPTDQPSDRPTATDRSVGQAQICGFLDFDFETDRTGEAPRRRYEVPVAVPAGRVWVDGQHYQSLRCIQGCTEAKSHFVNIQLLLISSWLWFI